MQVVIISATVFYYLLLLIQINNANSLAPSSSSSPTVRTTLGLVKGKTLYSIPEGKRFYAYLGIPYAKPPIGELRFKAPKRLLPWKGVLNAYNDGPKCIQKTFLYQYPTIEGQEDCLYLNIYTPNVNKYARYPVMVYIHEGGFFQGSGSYKQIGPEYLLNKQVILVTFNYRLGPLGFLSTGTEDILGNAGLKDQVAVLKWVQKNIINFGGNPNKVTIFGQSAGGASVHHHILSKMSSGLFHQAISQSGVSLHVWANVNRELAGIVAKAQAQFVQCPIDNITIMTQCLRSVDAIKLVNSTSLFHSWGTDPLTVYGPVMEVNKIYNNEERFQTENPYTLLRKGDINHVPFALGIVPGEGTVHANAILNNPDLVNDFNNRQLELGPFILGLRLSAQESEQVNMWKNISNYYLNSITTINPASDDSIKFINMYGDKFFVHGVYQAAELHRLLNTAPVFLYEFSYRGTLRYKTVFAHGDTAKYNDAGHCDELNYLFRNTENFNPRIRLQYPDTYIRDLMTTLWTNFAKYGVFNEPYEHNNYNPLPEWKPLSKCGPLSFTNITLPLSVENLDFYNQRMEFLQSLPMFENSLADIPAVKLQNGCK